MSKSEKPLPPAERSAESGDSDVAGLSFRLAGFALIPPGAWCERYSGLSAGLPMPLTEAQIRERADPAMLEQLEQLEKHRAALREAYYRKLDRDERGGSDPPVSVPTK